MTECRDWLKTLWPGSYKGVPFFYESADMSGGRGIVVHTFANRDDPFLEDLGEEPRYFECALYIASDDVDRAGDALDDTLASRGAGMLVDPVKGPILVRAMEFKRKHERDRLGYLAYTAKFVREGAATALISIPLAGRLVIAAGDALASAVASLFSAVVSTSGQPDFVAAAANNGVQDAAGMIEAVRLSAPVDPAASAIVRDAVAALVVAAPDLLGRKAASSAAIAALLAGVPDLGFVPATGAGAMAGAVLSTVRALAAGMAPTDAQTAMADFVEANGAIFASNYLTPSARIAAVNAAEAARLARLAGLIAWSDALRRRVYATRPDGVTARAEAAERFEHELNACQGAAYAPLYLAIEGLRASVVDFLTRLIADLAPIVTVTGNASMPALWWAWRLYADPARSGELVSRNRVRHPSFMPQKFSALSR